MANTYEYEPTTARTARNYNITGRDVIFCQMIAAGINRADCYHVVYNRQGTRNDRTTTDADAAELLKNNPGMRLLIQKIKNNKRVNTNTTAQEVNSMTRAEEEGAAEELKSRQGVANRMRRELGGVSGKDAIAGLLTLAKLEGYDKEQTGQEEEKRRYFLPYLSHCRTCKLMQAYRASTRE